MPDKDKISALDGRGLPPDRNPVQRFHGFPGEERLSVGGPRPPTDINVRLRANRDSRLAELLPARGMASTRTIEEGANRIGEIRQVCLSQTGDVDPTVAGHIDRVVIAKTDHVVGCQR